MPNKRFEQAIAAIDAANADDPHCLIVRGKKVPKELAHAELASEWVRRLCDQPSETLLLAARGHHIMRWTSPRSEYPEGRHGYLQWREELKRRHAQDTTEILEQCGYSEAETLRVRTTMLRRQLKDDDEAQCLEDALCLVFFETQLEDLGQRVTTEKLVDVGRKTLRKMTPKARQLVLGLDLPEAQLSILRELVEEL